MKREQRRQYLETIENYAKKSKKSNSYLAYWFSAGYNKSVVKRIKNKTKQIHPWDYKNRYPIAVNVLTRICFPKDRDMWGREVELKHDLIKNICLRENELLKRFRGLVRKYNKKEDKTTEMLYVIMDSNISRQTKNKLMESITPNDSIYYDTILFVLSL